MADLVPAERPALTLPPAAAEVLRTAYAGAGVILEYGSGGSTILAGDMPGKRVFSVESDADWARRMRGWFAANPPVADVTIHHANIGPTKDWGHPADETHFRRWPNYANSVWDREDFVHPDVVLVDGRFRPACLVTVAMRIQRPVTVLFDDYRARDAYHKVESLLKPDAMIGRMARFDLSPRPFPVDRLGWLVSLFLKPL
ncbi:MAG: hypothetical protein Q7J57_05610 [Gemmobacter sp.]|nr:hypothetical protein [Gemmobacter sp.]